MRFIILTIYLLIQTSTSYSQNDLIDIEKKETYLNQKYKKAKKLYIDKQYNLSLKNSLELISSLNKNSQDVLLKYRAMFLIGDIFSEINEKNKAINYYKIADSLYSKYKNTYYFDKKIILKP